MSEGEYVVQRTGERVKLKKKKKIPITGSKILFKARPTIAKEVITD